MSHDRNPPKTQSRAPIARIDTMREDLARERAAAFERLAELARALAGELEDLVRSNERRIARLQAGLARGKPCRG